MMKIAIIHGPNLNLLGIRESHIYGSQPWEPFFVDLQTNYPQIQLTYYQSNIEGELINHLHRIGFSYEGIILNAGAYTHTSIALADAIAGISTPVMEVHISNIYAREPFRHISYLSKNCIGTISGLGFAGYELAIQYFLKNLKKTIV